MESESLATILKNHEFLAGLTTPQLEFLTSCVRNVRYEAGTYLFREGDEADLFLLLRDGRVWLEAQVPGRGAVMLETLRKDDVLGLSWMYPPYRWYLDARAADTVRAFAFDAKCLRAKMEEDHDLGYEIAKRLLHHLYGRLERVRLQRLDLYKTEPVKQ